MGRVSGSEEGEGGSRENRNVGGGRMRQTRLGEFMRVEPGISSDSDDRGVREHTTDSTLDNREYRQQTLHNYGNRGGLQNDTVWGDFPRYDKEGFRLIYNNVNGISMSDGMSDVEEIGEAMQTFRADMFCAAEINLDARARNVVQQCVWKLRQYAQKAKVSMSSSASGQHQRQYLPGGTMTVVAQPWVHHTVTKAERDSMGRWTEATIQGKQGRVVTVLTVYRVVANDVGRSGPDTAYMQQWTMLSLRNVPEPDPRQQVLEDLSTRVKELTNSGHEVIINIDANESTQRQGVFQRWVRDHQLVDIMVQRHGCEDEPATHIRGSSRIDYILMTTTIAQHVTAAGILPFEEIVMSDHRALFVDIDLQGYLQESPNWSADPTKRGIRSNNPRAILKYREQLSNYLDTSGIELEIAQLNEDIERGIDADEMHRRMDEIDSKFTQARLQAESACDHISADPWSPKLRDSRRKRRFWRLWLSELLNGRDFSALRTALRMKIVKTTENGIVKIDTIPIEATTTDATDSEHMDTDDSANEITVTLPMAKRELQRSKKELRAVLQEAERHREAHLQECADMAAADGKVDKARAIIQLRNAERRRGIYQRLRRIMGKTHNGGLTHIMTPGADETWDIISDKDDMEQALIDRNIKHFSQADGTPFTTSPLIDIFGLYGTNEDSRKLLLGQFSIDELDVSEATKELLRQLKRIAPEGSVDATVTAEDVRAGYKRWRESTSTSPSGLHLGHDKVLFRFEPRDLEDPPEAGWLSDRVFRIKAQLLNWAVQHSIVYTRWKTIINTMLEKIPGRPLIHKLRVIHLIESDFNLLIGILWGRRLMEQGEKLMAFGEEQGGSRKDRKAQDVLLFKHMVYSTMRLTRTSCGTFDNDAKSCYDRIVMLFASLTAQRLGMDPLACKLFLKVLEKVRYKIKTHFGVSEGGYKSTPQTGIHGPGQGGRGSPAVWIIECCLAMACMSKRTEGVWFTDPYRQREVRQNMTGFVDDTTHWLNMFLQDLHGLADAAEMLHRMTGLAQWWEQLLYAMGGKLELDKCFYYLTTWRFNGEGVPQIAEGSGSELTI